MGGDIGLGPPELALLEGPALGAAFWGSGKGSGVLWQRGPEGVGLMLLSQSWDPGSRLGAGGWWGRKGIQSTGSRGIKTAHVGQELFRAPSREKLCTCLSSPHPHPAGRRTPAWDSGKTLKVRGRAQSHRLGHALPDLRCSSWASGPHGVDGHLPGTSAAQVPRDYSVHS